MQITFHGKLADDYGANHTIYADSVAEAMRGLSTQLKLYDKIPVDIRPVLRVVGHNSVESLQEKPEQIDVMIAIQGGGGGVGKILLGAALIGLSFVPGGVAGSFLLGKFAGAAMSLGVGLVLAGASQLFIKAPSISKQSDPEASKYLGLGNNTTQLGTLRSYSMGLVKITAPHVIAVNVDSNNLVKGEFPA